MICVLVISNSTYSYTGIVAGGVPGIVAGGVPGSYLQVM